MLELPRPPSALTENTQQPDRRKKPPFGISFLGIGLIMAGIATLAAVAIPLWFSQPSITLEGAANLLVEDILQVQENAIMQRMGSRIEFDADGGGYQAMDSSGLALLAPMGNGPYLRDYDVDAVFEGVLITEVDFGGKRRLEFDQGGYALHDGHVILTFRGKSKRVVFDANEAYVQGADKR